MLNIRLHFENLHPDKSQQAVIPSKKASCLNRRLLYVRGCEVPLHVLKSVDAPCNIFFASDASHNRSKRSFDILSLSSSPVKCFQPNRCFITNNTEFLEEFPVSGLFSRFIYALSVLSFWMMMDVRSLANQINDCGKLYPIFFQFWNIRGGHLQPDLSHGSNSIALPVEIFFLDAIWFWYQYASEKFTITHNDIKRIRLHHLG